MTCRLRRRQTCNGKKVLVLLLYFLVEKGRNFWKWSTKSPSTCTVHIRTITKYFPSLLFVCLARDLSSPSFLEKVLNLRLDGTPKRKGRKGGKKGTKCEIKSTPLFLSPPPLLLLYFFFRFGKEEEEEETLNHVFLPSSFSLMPHAV